MSKPITQRKSPMIFVNRGGKSASGTAVGDKEPDRSPMDGRSIRTGPAQPYDIERMESDRARASGRPQNAVAGSEKSPAARSSRA